MDSVTIKKEKRGQGGYVLVLALLTLLILTLLAIAGLTSSSFESTIAGNDWRAKQTLYKAEGGTELGIEMLEYNFACGSIAVPRFTNTVQVDTPRPFHNDAAPTPPYPTAAARDICWPSEDTSNPNVADCVAGANAEQTNISIFGQTELAPGSAIQMAAGYEGRGKGAASGGAIQRHQIVSRNTLIDASTATVQIEWIHVIGSEDHGSLCF